MVGDKIVVVGGQADGALVKQTEVFDGTKWSAGAELPNPREHLAAAGCSFARMLERGFGIVLLETRVRFRRELRHGDGIDVDSRLVFGTGRTFTMDHTLLRADGETAAEIGCVMGLLDQGTRRLVPDPAARLRDLALIPAIWIGGLATHGLLVGGFVGPVFGQLSLDDVKGAKNEHGCTVNDVVVSICTGAVRRWLLEHDARIVVRVEPRLPGQFEEVRYPIGAASLIVQVR